MTPPPLIARTNWKRLLLSPGKCSRIGSVVLHVLSHVVAAHRTSDCDCRWDLGGRLMLPRAGTKN